MGGSNSVMMSAGVFNAAMTDTPISDDVVNKILLNQISLNHLKVAFPFPAVRQLRHMYTHNFAIILYSCIREIAEMARRAMPLTGAVNGDSGTAPSANALPFAEPISRDQLTRFTNAVQLLRHLMPGVLESGMTPFEIMQHPVTQAHAMTASRADASDGQSTNRTEACASTATSARAASVEPSTLSASATQTKRRTRSTLRFRQLFFDEDNMCQDAHPEAVFEPLWCQTSPSPVHARARTGSLTSTTVRGRFMTLGEVLSWSLVECCFVPGLTLPQSAAKNHVATFSMIHPEVQFNVLWQPGIACPNPFDKFVPVTQPSSFTAGWVTPVISTSLLRHREEILHTLLFTTSAALYDTSEEDDEPDLVRPLLSTAIVPRMPTLMASMLNTVLNYSPYGSLPYTSHIVGAEENLMVACARVMVSLTCHTGVRVVDRPAQGQAGSTLTTAAHPPGPSSLFADHATHSVASSSVSGTSATGREENKPNPLQYIHCCCKLIQNLTMAEIKFVLEKLRNIISVNAYATSTVLPDSQRSLISTDEFMLLLWKLMDLSPTMLTQLVTSDHVHAYLLPVVRYALQFRASPDVVNQSHIGLFILLRMSEVRGFAMQCNKPFTAQTVYPLPQVPAKATYNDFIVLAMCLIFESKTLAVMRRSRFAAMLVSNVAPYITHLSEQASVRLTIQFACACNRLLFNLPAPTSSSYRTDHPLPMDEVVLCLCEAIASLLQYQEKGSKYVLATLIDLRQLIQRMSDIYESRSPGDYTLPVSAKLLIQTLQLAVTTALPAVASLGISTLPKPAKLRAIAGGSLNYDNGDAGGVGSANGGAGIHPASTYVDSTSDGGAARVTRAQGSAVAADTVMGDRDGDEMERNGSTPSSTSRRDEYVDLPTGATTTVSPAAVPLKSVIQGPHLADSPAAMARLNELTLVGALPAPHAIVAKKFFSGPSMDVWATKMFWISMFMFFPEYSFGDNASLKLIEAAAMQR